jgi:thiol-disulfide isomerase/thioredoxin
LELKALDGGAVRFDEFRGQVVLIDFWATWCGPCIRELPKLQALHARYERDGFVVVGVSFDRERSKLDAFLAARKIPWRQIYPDDAAKKTIADTLDVTGGYLPMVYIILELSIPNGGKSRGFAEGIAEAFVTRPCLVFG